MVKHDDVYGEREDASRRAATNMLTRVGTAIEQLDRWVIEAPDGEHHIHTIVLKVRFDDVGDILLLAKAEGGDGKCIAFQSGDSFSDVLKGFNNRLINGTVQWREDIPYDQRNNNA